MYYYYRAAWTSAGEDPVMHIFPHWNWAVLPPSNNTVSVRVFSNADTVTLTLNGQLVGSQDTPVPPMGHVQWSVPWVAGELVATGRRRGQLHGQASVKTAKTAHALSLQVISPTDSTGSQLRADGQDAAIVAVTVVDEDGTTVPDADHHISFSTSGGCGSSVVGIANGDPASLERTRAADGSAFNGKIAAIVQQTVAAPLTGCIMQQKPPLQVSASSPGLVSATITLSTQVP
jgi:beta-galactosidase